MKRVEREEATRLIKEAAAQRRLIKKQAKAEEKTTAEKAAEEERLKQEAEEVAVQATPIVAATAVVAADVEASAEREEKTEKLKIAAAIAAEQERLIAAQAQNFFEELVVEIAAEAAERFLAGAVKKAVAAKEAKDAEEVEKERKLGWKQRRLIQRQAQVKERTVEDGSLEDQKAAADSFDEEMSRIAAEIESRK